MTHREKRPALGLGIYVSLTVLAGLYFTFASVQGDYGLLRRIQIDAEGDILAAQLDTLRAEVAAYRNKTRRLSDDYLDLDLLDEQTRDVLGYVRADEIVLR